MKLDKNIITGASVLIITVICGIFSLNGGMGSVLIASLFYIAAAAAILIAYSFVLPQMIGVGADWLCFAPFTIMLIVSRAILGWDIFMPFYVSGFFAVTADMFAKSKQKNKHEALIIAGTGAASVLLFALISFCGGIML